MFQEMTTRIAALQIAATLTQAFMTRIGATNVADDPTLASQGVKDAMTEVAEWAKIWYTNFVVKILHSKDPTSWPTLVDLDPQFQGAPPPIPAPSSAGTTATPAQPAQVASTVAQAAAALAPTLAALVK